MKPAIHQFIPSFVAGTAVGNHTLQVRALLQHLGFRSEVYVGEVSEELQAISHPFRSFQGDAPAWLLYQASTGSPMVEFLIQRREPKIVNYHNMTPASLFGPWEPQVGAELALGRQQLAELAPVAALGIADSTYNREELDVLGCRRTVVAPILLDLGASAAPADGATLERLLSKAGSGTTWLFVGRIAPNKAQHDLIKALAVYRRTFDHGARLLLVGGSSSHAYLTALQRFCAAFDLQDAVDFVGAVTDEELAAYYAAADVFVCASDHEGFCVPLLEAMHHRLPIVAYASTAVPETLGAGGLALKSKEPAILATAVHRVVSDRALAARLIESGCRRVADFDLSATRASFASAISSLDENLVQGPADPRRH